MRIGIDCRLAGAAHGGIGRYIAQLVQRLPGTGSRDTWVFFFSDATQAQSVLGVHLANVEVVFAPIKHYTIREQLRMPRIFAAAKLDLLHIPHFNIPLLYRGKIIVTIHDLLWHERGGSEATTLPRWQYTLKYAAYRYIVRQAVRRAGAIIVPTKTIAEVLGKYYPQSLSKTTVAYEGVDQNFLSIRPRSKVHVLRQWHLEATNKYLLYVGSLYPHKNVRLVIDALSELRDYHLICIGTRNVFQKKLEAYVQQKKLRRRVHFLGYAPDEQFVDLLSISEALVQPSFSEGFGLTGVEALTAGYPVVASDIPVFREVYQDASTYFDPHSVTEFVNAVKHCKKPSLSQRLSFRKLYDWQGMTNEIYQLYSQVLSPNDQTA